MTLLRESAQKTREVIRNRGKEIGTLNCLILFEPSGTRTIVIFFVIKIYPLLEMFISGWAHWLSTKKTVHSLGASKYKETEDLFPKWFL